MAAAPRDLSRRDGPSLSAETQADLPSPVSAGPPLLNLQMVADRLGVSPPHVRRLLSERRIPFLRLGRLLRFDPAELDS
jgi:excisionase family DNA binding protein